MLGLRPQGAGLGGTVLAVVDAGAPDDGVPAALGVGVAGIGHELEVEPLLPKVPAWALWLT